MLGALHYFEDYTGMLGLIASAVTAAPMSSSTFRAEHDTANAPDGVQTYVRQSGQQ